MQRLTGGLLLLLALTVGATEEQPRAVVAEGGELTLTLPESLMRNDEVNRQLTSGLTTVFIVTIKARHDRETTEGGARIDIRFELWEEKYLVTVLEATGQENELEFDTKKSLAEWWTTNPLVVTMPTAFGREVKVEARLKLLPFSRQEQKSARRWLARTLAVDETRTETDSRSADILRIIVETSVQRRPLFEYRWTIMARRAKEK